MRSLLSSLPVLALPRRPYPRLAPGAAFFRGFAAGGLSLSEHAERVRHSGQ